MKVAVCYNQVPTQQPYGMPQDRLSEAGAETEARAVLDALRQLGHHPALIPLGDGIVSFTGKLHLLRPAVVFNLCEGFHGYSRHEMHVAGLFDLLGLPTTGSPAFTLGLTRDKARTKDLLVRHGIPTPGYHLIGPGRPLPRLSYRAPLIVKPAHEDASLSLTWQSVVTTEKSLKKQVALIHETYRQAALIEEFIEGREFNVALLGNNPCRVLPIAEIRFAPDLPRSIVSYQGKWQEDSADFKGTLPVCPAELNGHAKKTIEQVALKCWKLLGCRDYARVDIRWRSGVPYVLEMNANPDISPDAGLARAARCAGIEYPALIGGILDMAAARKGKDHEPA